MNFISFVVSKYYFNPWCRQGWLDQHHLLLMAKQCCLWNLKICWTINTPSLWKHLRLSKQWQLQVEPVVRSEHLRTMVPARSWTVQPNKSSTESSSQKHIKILSEKLCVKIHAHRETDARLMWMYSRWWIKLLSREWISAPRKAILPETSSFFFKLFFY